MAATVRLKDIVDALEMQSDEYLAFLNLETGQVETVERDLLSEVEDGDEEEDPPEGEEPDWDLAKQIVSTDHFVKLPTKFDVHEWAIMEDFSISVKSDRIREDLLDAIHGAGAFRSFKSAIRRHHIEQAWFVFRDDALRQIAIDWCEEHEIAWE